MSDYLFLYIILIFLFPLILMCINAWLDYQRIRSSTQRPESSGIENPDSNETQKSESKGTDDKDISGFRRSIIALTLILIIGISLFHLIAGDAVDEISGDVVGNILSMLTGVVASIAGFYFGGKVALDSASEKSPKNNSGENEKKQKTKKLGNTP